MKSNATNPVQPCPNKKKPAPDPKKKWIKFLVQDDKGVPLANVRFHVTLPDGSTEEVCSNEKGVIEIFDIDEGNCKIEADWKEHVVDDTVLLQS